MICVKFRENPLSKIIFIGSGHFSFFEKKNVWITLQLI